MSFLSLLSLCKQRKPWNNSSVLHYTESLHVYLNHKCTSSALIGQVWNRVEKSCIQACLLGKKLSLHAHGHFLLFLINELILPGMTCQNPCPLSRQSRCIVKIRKCLLCSLFVNGQGFWHFIPGINAILPSWTLILSESWGKSKTDFKGEVDGFKIEEREGPGEELIKCYLKVTYLARKFTCTCPGLLDGTFLEPCGNGCNLKILARANLNQKVLFTNKVNYENTLTKF